MTPDMDDDALVLTAAESVTDTLVEVLRVIWPTCPSHPGPPISLRPRPAAPAPAWFCDRGDHDVALLGELTYKD